MRQQNESSPSLNVRTMRPAEFAEACRTLAGQVREEFGQWQLVVGIASGGLHMLPWFVSDGVGAVSVGMRRRSTAKKQGLVGRVISKMPEKVCDFLRKTESRVYDLLERKGTGQEPVEGTATDLPADALSFELYLKLWRRGRGEESGDGPLRVLIVDDAADSGATLRKVSSFVAKLLPDADIATAVLTATRQSGAEAADYALFDDRTLLRFPWAPDYRPIAGETTLPTMRSAKPTAGTQAREERELTVCDLDGTLLATNSFTRFVAWIPRVAPRLAPKLIAIVASRKLRRITHAEAKQRILALVEGELTAEQIEGWCVSLLDEYGRDWIVETLRHYQKRGVPALLATAAPSLYASVIARLCEIDYCVATERGGQECAGERKLDRVRDLADAEEATPALFLSDHAEDLPLARWTAGQGGAVVWCR